MFNTHNNLFSTLADSVNREMERLGSDGRGCRRSQCGLHHFQAIKSVYYTKARCVNCARTDRILVDLPKRSARKAKS